MKRNKESGWRKRTDKEQRAEGNASREKEIEKKREIERERESEENERHGKEYGHTEVRKGGEIGVRKV